MRIVFIGTVKFSRCALERVLDMGADVAGVVTRKRSSFNADFADLAPLCEERGVPYLYVQDVNAPESVDWIRSHAPDVIFCFGWSMLLKKEILGIPPLGVVGYHPAKLPMNRGRHPIIWALALGLHETASTFFLMDEGADSGDILSRRPVDIVYGDDAGSLYDRITDVALEQIETLLPELGEGTCLPKPQDHSKANYWRKRNEEDGKIDFRMSSRSVYNLVRALASPYVGAHFCHDGREVKVWKVKEVEIGEKNIEPGKVISVSGDQFTVKCGENAVTLIEHELKSPPEVGEYLF